MLGFFFKKNFYDGWDNVILFFVPNLILDLFLLICGSLFFLGTKMNSGSLGIIIWIFSFLFILIIASILILSWAESAAEIANYEVAEIKTFFSKIKSCIKDGILYALLLFFVITISVIGFIYYFKPGTKTQISFIGLMAGSVFCWVSITIILGLFLYPAMRALLHNSFKKTLKKCFIVLFDNFGKCIILNFYNLFLFLLSIIMLGLTPGLGGIGLSNVNFLRLLLKKYDYLEEKENSQNNKKTNSHKIPWNEILAEDIEITGTRSFKSFFMPWKE